MNLKSIKESWKRSFISYFLIKELKYFLYNFPRPWRIFTDLQERPKSKLIYIASPYSHEFDETRINNFKSVSKFAAKLVHDGNVVISPITYGHTLLEYHEMPSNWDFWKSFCLSFLERCDEMIVYQMPGWESSRGVKEEIKFAQSKGIKITYQEFK